MEIQSRENAYDLEANLAVLKLYQFNPHNYNTDIVAQILLKALTNYPHTDFILCKCLLSETHVSTFVCFVLFYLDLGSIRKNAQAIWLPNFHF